MGKPGGKKPKKREPGKTPWIVAPEAERATPRRPRKPIYGKLSEMLHRAGISPMDVIVLVGLHGEGTALDYQMPTSGPIKHLLVEQRKRGITPLSKGMLSLTVLKRTFGQPPEQLITLIAKDQLPGEGLHSHRFIVTDLKPPEKSGEPYAIGETREYQKGDEPPEGDKHQFLLFEALMRNFIKNRTLHELI